MGKRLGTKRLEHDICSVKPWSIKGGQIVRQGSDGKVGKDQLFKVVGEKLPFDAIEKVEEYVEEKIGKKRIEGVYLAHDSMGCPRYIGRGKIFNRLKLCKKSISTRSSIFRSSSLPQKNTREKSKRYCLELPPTWLFSIIKRFGHRFNMGTYWIMKLERVMWSVNVKRDQEILRKEGRFLLDTFLTAGAISLSIPEHVLRRREPTR